MATMKKTAKPATKVNPFAKGSSKLGKKAMKGQPLMGASMTMPMAPKKGGKMPMLKVKGK